MSVDEYFKLTNDQLSSLLVENTLKVESEAKLFDMVVKWVRHKQHERQKYLATLMAKVRLPLLSGEELVDLVSPHWPRYCV